MSRLKIYHKETEEILFECSIEEREKAYQKLEEFKELQLDVVLKMPSTPETLLGELNMPKEFQDQYRKSLEDEIEDHNDESCCYKIASLDEKN